MHTASGQYGGRDVGIPASALPTHGLPSPHQDPGQLKIHYTSNEDALAVQLAEICRRQYVHMQTLDRDLLPKSLHSRLAGSQTGRLGRSGRRKATLYPETNRYRVNLSTPFVEKRLESPCTCSCRLQAADCRFPRRGDACALQCEVRCPSLFALDAQWSGQARSRADGAQPWSKVGKLIRSDDPQALLTSDRHNIGEPVGHACPLVVISSLYVHVSYVRRKTPCPPPSDAATQVLRQPAVSTGLLS